MKNELRWKQRFQNFEKAFLLIDEVVTGDIKQLNQLEMEGLIQRFEILIELSWKTLKDYLENEGYDDVKNGKQAIRQAFVDGIISDADVWMSALQKRNLTSNTYNESIVKEMLIFICEDFYPIVKSLHKHLKLKL
ncbi:MAG: nucleotidyltransferase [Candidatus Cloacimonadota bacterium]|nr:MAG: nucleotidyltransferase [Candidatus Cloacimonadota bacterium]